MKKSRNPAPGKDRAVCSHTAAPAQALGPVAQTTGPGKSPGLFSARGKGPRAIFSGERGWPLSLGLARGSGPQLRDCPLQQDEQELWVKEGGDQQDPQVLDTQPCVFSSVRTTPDITSAAAEEKKTSSPSHEGHQSGQKLSCWSQGHGLGLRPDCPPSFSQQALTSAHCWEG